MPQRDPGRDEVLNIEPQSYWLASTQETAYPALEEDISCDIAVVGGGMAGITAAYLLKQEGFKVVVVEADRILQGTTGHTTAKITSQHGLIYNRLKKKMGLEKAQVYAHANESAAETIRQIIAAKGIDCDYEEQPAYVYTHSEKYVGKIADEALAAASLGLKATYLEEIPLPFSVKAALRFDGQAQFHPRKYLLALAKEIPGGGSHIFEQTRAVMIREGEPTVVATERGPAIKASRVLVASHYPFYDKPGLYYTRLYQDRSYILGVTIKGKFPGGMYLSAETPARSLRAQDDQGGELILVGGENHKTGHGKSTADHYRNLLDFARQTFTVERLLYRWSTQDCITADLIPYIGPLAPSTPNIFVATGFRKWGMTGSTVAAMIITGLVVKGEHPWLCLYNPSRFNLASVAKLVKENTDVAARFVTGKLWPGPSARALEPNQGAVMRQGMRRVGAYRDAKGELHLVDTSCTHLRCELNWNDAETTWDCPCHGSRFNCDGGIVDGPAVYPLPEL